MKICLFSTLVALTLLLSSLTAQSQSLPTEGKKEEELSGCAKAVKDISNNEATIKKDNSIVFSNGEAISKDGAKEFSWGKITYTRSVDTWGIEVSMKGSQEKRSLHLTIDADGKSCKIHSKERITSDGSRVVEYHREFCAAFRESSNDCSERKKECDEFAKKVERLIEKYNEENDESWFRPESFLSQKGISKEDSIDEWGARCKYYFSFNGDRDLGIDLTGEQDGVSDRDESKSKKRSGRIFDLKK